MKLHLSPNSQTKPLNPLSFNKLILIFLLAASPTLSYGEDEYTGPTGDPVVDTQQQLNDLNTDLANAEKYQDYQENLAHNAFDQPGSNFYGDLMEQQIEEEIIDPIEEQIDFMEAWLDTLNGNEPPPDNMA